MWQDFIKNGDACAVQYRWLDAEQFYFNAIDQIELEWANDNENFKLLVAWIDSLHKLSALFQAQGQDKAALRYLSLPYQWALTTLDKDTLSPSFRTMVTHALTMTLNPLLVFSQQYPMCENCLESLEATQDWLNETQQVLH